MRIITLGVSIVLAATGAAAATRTAVVNAISADGIGPELGTVTFSDSPGGLAIAPNLKGLPPGTHGFHIHENPSCAPAPNSEGKATAGLAAGGHYDPDKTGKHLGPEAAGHRGDLPALIVKDDQTATAVGTAPRLKTDDLAGRAVVIHAGGDNYADQPAPLGGGGARIACGVVQ